MKRIFCNSYTGRIFTSCQPALAIVSALLFFTSLAGQAITALPLTNHAFAQLADTKAADEEENTQLYGCELIGGAIHCDPVLNKFESYIVEGSTDRIYAVTKNVEDIQFAEGVGGSRALGFNAYFGEFVNIKNNAILNPLEFSVSFWVKRSADLGFYNYGHVISHINARFTAGWLFDIGNTTSQSIRFGVTNDNGTVFYVGEALINSNGFTHIVGTFNGSSIRVYGNGVLLNAVPFSGTFSPDPGVPLKIAMSSYNFGFPWEGVIDEVQIYNKSLTGEEIKSLFVNNSNSIENNSNSSSLIGYWSFDGSVTDVSSNNNPTEYMIQTVGMAFTSDGRLLFTEKNTGKIRVMMTGQNDTVLEEPFAIVPDLHHDMEQGLLGIAVDPDFEQNHYVYVYYTAKEKNATASMAPINRVVRFTDVNNTGTDMTVIIDRIPAHRGGMHAGGAITFGPHDGKLYITIGNAYHPNAAQDNTSLLGKVLRINKDGTIPEDNPFPNSAVFTLGHRNHYGIAFDKSGNGIVTENGDDLYDEINLLVRGGNYGYPTLQPPNRPPVLAAETNETDSVEPIRSYWKTVAPTQAIHYDGTKFPELSGKFLVGSYNNGRLYALEINQNNKTVSHELKIEFPSRIQSNIIAVAQSPLTGDIYYGGYYIYKLQSFDINSREPILANVQIIYPSSYVEVTDLQLLSHNNSMLTISLKPTEPPVLLSSSTALVVEVPKLLLDGIYSVSLKGGPLGNLLASEEIDFSINNQTNANYNTVTIDVAPIIGKYQDLDEFKITIAGNATTLGLR